MRKRLGKHERIQARRGLRKQLTVVANLSNPVKPRPSSPGILLGTPGRVVGHSRSSDSLLAQHATRFRDPVGNIFKGRLIVKRKLCKRWASE